MEGDYLGIELGALEGSECLADGSVYCWRVRSFDNHGGSYGFVAQPRWFFFNSQNDPPNPVDSVLSPQGGEAVNDLMPTISWYPASDPDLSDGFGEIRYTLQVDIDGEFDTSVTYEYVTPFGQHSITTDSLEDETFWYYRIQAEDDEGATSAWSAIYDFWTNWRNDFPAAFVLFNPPDEQTATKSDPVFHWQTAVDTDPLDSVAYTLQIAIDSNFQFMNKFTGISDTTFAYPDSFPLNRDFWWRVKAEDAYEGETWSTEAFRFKTVVIGDPNADGIVNVSDVVFLVTYIFAGGEEPYPLFAGDADCDGIVNVSDAVYLITYIFGGGPPPCEP